MKKNITSYLCAISDDEYDIFFEILCYKYQSMMNIYWMLKEYSEDISELKYRDKTKKNILRISVTFHQYDAKDVKHEILTNEKFNNDSIQIDARKKEMVITITTREAIED